MVHFETAYERLGIPALIIQVATGLWLAHRLLPDLGEWFSGASGLSRLIIAKLVLLFLTLAFALHARFRLIPKLTAGGLNALAYHIVAVTLISVLFVIVGVGFRTGGIF